MGMVALFRAEARVEGPDPKRTSHGAFFAFNDPDGTRWIVQEGHDVASGRTRSGATSRRSAPGGATGEIWSRFLEATMASAKNGEQIPSRATDVIILASDV